MKRSLSLLLLWSYIIIASVIPISSFVVHALSVFEGIGWLRSRTKTLPAAAGKSSFWTISSLHNHSSLIQTFFINSFNRVSEQSPKLKLLPSEIITYTFCQLSTAQIALSACVSTTWRRQIQSDLILHFVIDLTGLKKRLTELEAIKLVSRLASPSTREVRLNLLTSLLDEHVRAV